MNSEDAVIETTANPELKSAKERLRELGIELPGFNPAAANYMPVTQRGELLYTAGQTPKKEGLLVYKGKLGGEISDQDGYDAVMLCTLNTLTLLDYYADGLNNIDQILKVTVFLNCTPDYVQHSKVADGATDLLVSVFGDAGRPARSAVGVNALPGGAACEVEMIAALKSK